MSILHPNPKLPIWLGTGTEANVKMTAEIADGWLTLGLVPGNWKLYQAWIEAGFARAGNGKSWQDFEIQPSAAVIVTDDVRSALARIKPNIALYVGGMGHKNINFHNQMMVRRGYADAAARIQELYLADARRRPPTRCPTSSSTTARWSVRPRASASASRSGKRSRSPASRSTAKRPARSS